MVPADDKPNARLIVSEIILDSLRALKLTPPKASKEQKKELIEFPKKAVSVGRLQVRGEHVCRGASPTNPPPDIREGAIR